MRSPLMRICRAVSTCVLAIAMQAPLSAAEQVMEGATSPSMGVAGPTVGTEAASGSVGPGLGRAIDPSALDVLRGGESSVQSEVRNDGHVDGNSADGVVSGGNVVSGGSFANAAGISTVIQNSGSNVLIQNGTAVNVQFVDPTP